MKESIVKIRRAHKKDAEIIADFNRNMAMETEGKDLPSETILKGVKNLIENSQWGFYIIAEKEGQIAGSLLITYEWSDWRNGLFWWIQSVYVVPAFRRQGIYKKMYDFVQSEALKHDHIRGFRLYVETENKTAQKTYESLGMKQCAYILYETEKIQTCPEETAREEHEG